MKRLVTLGITLALVMGLFCFSVNADNIVIQGESDTVTATYGSNDITIALRARRLRVVNTGTAAAGYAGYTPVIVSVTIYNLGNQNCLVNNLKFRLTSESAEYRIAGFENISPDLFISDTAYDTTGFLSLKASNDYTYGGGFVVPANSNMTYVGIINLSANWITENQTWRTVDLSTATFYDNLTTTVGDYPCDAEPVDLTSIENILDDMLQVMQGIDLDVSSIHGLISNLVDACTYTGTVPSNLSENAGVFADDTPNNYLFDKYRISMRRYISAPVFTSVDYELNSSSDSYTLLGTKRYNFTIILYSFNDNSKVLETYYLHDFRDVFNSITAYRGIQLTYFYSDIYETIGIVSDKLRLVLKNQNRSQYGIVPVGTAYTILQGYIEVPYNTVISMTDMENDDFIINNISLLDGYYPRNEYTILRDLYIAYSSVNGTGDLSNQANEASDQMAAIHNQEASYYAQNQAAIEATGLSNYQFSGEQSNGIGAVSNDFTALWNAIGSWNSVYIFSMTLTLALTILRHVPNRRKPKEKNTE